MIWLTGVTVALRLPGKQLANAYAAGLLIVVARGVRRAGLGLLLPVSLVAIVLLTWRGARAAGRRGARASGASPRSRAPGDTRVRGRARALPARTRRGARVERVRRPRLLRGRAAIGHAVRRSLSRPLARRLRAHLRAVGACVRRRDARRASRLRPVSLLHRDTARVPVRIACDRARHDRADGVRGRSPRCSRSAPSRIRPG